MKVIQKHDEKGCPICSAAVGGGLDPKASIHIMENMRLNGLAELVGVDGESGLPVYRLTRSGMARAVEVLEGLKNAE